ncbi:DUF3168 domain-containing protein [Virgibacillus sp. AGTR]|uniref:hypothetical protein n=1 Tax=Virgibacillus sp. AGTR TaxID=2812055 RepID=UPI001965995E|nr:hypothetical protein [Virgibacillus sp. AGTR]MCC2250496.1 DUF3168 domain-containing protein [Virgibacillus sp. AGTR]QRZ18291.1 hypothetical protein JUJ52_00555 [Virgibacillus sp. AGTR]
MDILDKIYKSLIADDYIKDQTLGRIKYYEYPETGDVTEPFIVIDPINPPDPSDYGSNKWMKYDYLIQIDVWSSNRKITDAIADKIRDIMWEVFGFSQKPGPQAYDKDTGVFRDARRYRGTLYRDDLDSL